MKTARILIVEDETIIALDIRSMLRQLGYQVTNMVRNYDDALQSVLDNEPDIILMDVRLENSKDGIETAQAIKDIKDIPIIYLTSFSDETTIKKAAQTNPITYITKPFKREHLRSTLLLEVHKLSLTKHIEPIRLNNNYSYDIQQESLLYKEEPLKLSNNEKSLLTILAGARGNIVSLDDLEHHIWPDKPVSESALRTLIYRLRSKLEDQFIETIPSIGCKLIPQKQNCSS